MDLNHNIHDQAGCHNNCHIPCPTVTEALPVRQDPRSSDARRYGQFYQLKIR